MYFIYIIFLLKTKQQYKKPRIMKIFLIWFGLICCGIANGLLYDESIGPRNIFFMAIPCLASLWLLFLHRRVTKGWKVYPDPWTGYRLPVFKITFCICVFAFLVFIMAPGQHEMELATAATIGISSFIALIREVNYTNDF